jgi:PAS domain S-box-containing protein
MAYIQEISQTLSNITLSKTPNYIIAVDRNMKIKEFNVAAQKLFSVSRNQALNRPLNDFMETSLFEKVFETKEDILDEKVEYPELDMITNQTIVYSAKENVAIAIIKNITEEEKRRQKLYRMKLNSVDMTQKVIDKQMMVAQEIASLLGETTAETKVTLNKLKGLIENEGL